MKTWFLTFTFILVCMFNALGLCQPIGREKKIITFSGIPNARAFRNDVEEMEELLPGVDGVSIYPSTYKGGVATEALGRPFRKDRHRIKDFDSAIDHMKAAKIRRYKHNFLVVYLTTGNKNIEVPDWFDPEFDAVVNNWKVAAEFCKRSGMKGILFDDEVYYGTNLWNYKGLKYEKTKTAEQYSDQAFLRGAQIMRAINTVYPDIHILSLHGPSQARGTNDYAVSYGLMCAFFDGLLSECTGKARIIDGHEMAYGYRSPVTYASARRFMKEKVRAFSRVPDKFDKHFQVGFSFFIGPFGTLGFSENFTKNYYTPEELAYSLHQALKFTDEYVWIYTQKCHLWKMGIKPGIVLPQVYRDALLNARNPQPELPVMRNLDAHAAPHPGSAMPPRKLGSPVRGFPQFVGYDEKETFGDLWANYTHLADLPSLWRFRIDPENIGVKGKWFGPDIGERGWFWITSLVPWDNHGYRTYDGYGWYRQTFEAPSLPKDKKLFLTFGAVAHGAEVYVNGTLAGHHNMDGWAYAKGYPWKERFLVDVTDHIHGGGKNLVAVRVVDYGPWGGGIWKPVKLIAEK